MRIQIKHEIKGRIRFSLSSYKKLSIGQADAYEAYLAQIDGVTSAKVYERTADAVVCFQGDRDAVLAAVCRYVFDKNSSDDRLSENSPRMINRKYQEKIIFSILRRAMMKLWVPAPVRACLSVMKAVKYIKEGAACLLGGQLKVPVLDAAAVSVSIVRKDFSTASSVMFMLGTGELLEEWTHKKSVADLAGSMALNVDKVWAVSGESEVLMPIGQVKENDVIIVRAGSMIPLDGTVTDGECTVNQSSMTGESEPVLKKSGSYVYAGTVIEEGQIKIQVRQTTGDTRYEKIITMIEQSEKLKSAAESRYEHLADQLVPYSFFGTGLTWLLTRNVTKALSVLMVDYSCALKLSMPVAVLSAMKDCSKKKITVKGGKFMEAVAQADTIVFDKTGTLTKSQPRVAEVVTFGGSSRDEMLRTAACLEEHFPHSIANAVVRQAEEEKLFHKEMHSKVEYVVAHGISSQIDGKKAVIGSYHFVFEDEQCRVPENEQEKFDALAQNCSHLYLAIEGVLTAAILIEDPLREEAPEVVAALKQCGFERVVMMTGDNYKTARTIAAKVGIDEFYAEVLPEDKAGYVEEMQRQGHRVIMVGDGINDSPALSAADVGVAVSSGAQIAREIADVTISSNRLYELVCLKQLSTALMQRIHRSYKFIIGFNTLLIGLGLTGMMQPATSAMFHNLSTLLIGLENLSPLKIDSLKKN